MGDNEGHLEVFKTSRGGIKLYINGFTFEKNKVLNDVYHWACEMRRNDIYNCRSCLNTTLDDKGNHVIKKTPSNHNHGPDPTRKKIADVKAKIKEEAALGKLPGKILESTAATTSSEVLENMPSTAALKQMIYRKKKKKLKVEEATDFKFKIDEEETKICGQNFIIKDRIFDDNKRILLMSTMNMMMNLSNSSYWILDGSFKAIESSIFKQFYTIHGNVFIDSGKTFPLLFCLSTHKDKRTYDIMFELIKEYGLENNINIVPNVVIIHFEKEVISSLCSSFENVIIQGSNYHLGQLVYRQVLERKIDTKYGTNAYFNKDVKCLLALRYIEESKIPVYYKKFFEQLEDSDSKTIAKWFDENYIHGTDEEAPDYPPNFWSCHKTSSMKIPRTHNTAERWHHKINVIIDKHRPNVYHMTRELIKETITNCDQIEIILSGNADKKKKKYSNKDELIESILEDRDNYTPVALLKAIATNLKL